MMGEKWEEAVRVFKEVGVKDPEEGRAFIGVVRGCRGLGDEEGEWRALKKLGGVWLRVEEDGLRLFEDEKKGEKELETLGERVKELAEGRGEEGDAMTSLWERVGRAREENLKTN